MDPEVSPRSRGEPGAMSWRQVFCGFCLLLGLVARAQPMQVRVLRLHPGQDLKRELRRFAEQQGIQAGVLVTCVGSLQKAVIRFADRSEGTPLEGKFEIVSLVGTLSPEGDHLHISLSDGEGHTVGGHLMDGCLIYTTAEIVVGEIAGKRFRRVVDPQTGYPELEP